VKVCAYAGTCTGKHRNRCLECRLGNHCWAHGSGCHKGCVPQIPVV
jgi:hypothetical protein